MIARLIAKLLADNPSIKAAMKAGRKTTLSARYYDAKLDRWTDLGPVSSTESSWASFLSQIPAVVLRFKVNGREVERSTF